MYIYIYIYIYYTHCSASPLRGTRRTPVALLNLVVGLGKESFPILLVVGLGKEAFPILRNFTYRLPHPLHLRNVVQVSLREGLRTGYGVRGTGYGLRFYTEIYGSKREKIVFHEYLQEACFVLIVQTSPKISGNLQEFTGECNLGILYSSSLLLLVKS